MPLRRQAGAWYPCASPGWPGQLITSKAVKVQLLAFASAGDALGRQQLEIEIEPGSTVADLVRWLDQRHPGLAPLWPRLAIAVDGELATAATPLSEGMEVALLPPVSGGCDATAIAAAPLALLTEAPIDTAAILGSLADPTCGAVLLFLGTVRNHHRGRRVLRLTYDAYRPMAEARLRTIVSELEAGSASPGHGPLRVAIVHRLGEVGAGEASVAIATVSRHRVAAYEANRIALERLKAEVPIWKREHYEDGEAIWREEETLLVRPPTVSS